LHRGLQPAWRCRCSFVVQRKAEARKGALVDLKAQRAVRRSGARLSEARTEEFREAACPAETAWAV
jgi:hypothetical protein